MNAHGAPCWYELTTGAVARSQAFYGPLLVWDFQDAGMEGFSYILALRDGAMVAGMMEPDTPMPEFWMVYFAVGDCAAACDKVTALGGKVFRAPEPIPGTGIFAIVVDPQGAAFGLLQPLEGQQGAAFDQMKQGHGNWHELHSTDPEAGLAFYTALLGWTPSTAMPMGEMGNYQLFAREGRDIGGMMRLQSEGVPSHWLPYFGAPSIKAAMAQIAELGGQVLHGPQEVPGGAFICMAQDSRGAHFALVGGA